MKVVVMGAGALGGYFGARLAAAGHQVTFVARGAHGAAMRTTGLEIRSGLGGLRMSPGVVASGAELRAISPVDLVVVAVKLGDSEAAAQELVPAVGAKTMVVSFQNGIAKDQMLVAAVGREHVIGAVAYLVATIAEPGVVAHSGTLQQVVFGELDGGTSGRVDRVVGAFAGAGVDSKATADIRRATWEQFVFLAAARAVTAASRATFGEVRANVATRALLRDAMWEVVMLARAEGITIADDYVDSRMAFLDGLPAQGRTSMADDLVRGRRLELDWLSGAVVRHATHAKVDVPVHRTLYATLALDAGGTRSGGPA